MVINPHLCKKQKNRPNYFKHIYFNVNERIIHIKVLKRNCRIFNSVKFVFGLKEGSTSTDGNFKYFLFLLEVKLQ